MSKIPPKSEWKNISIAVGVYADKKTGPGWCIEWFKPLDEKEIICGSCQEERDGRWDHLRQIKDEVAGS